MSGSVQHLKAHEFAALHEGEPFVIPNPWDAGSARVLEALGFRALATTSSGFAFTLGRLDGEVTLDEVVEHIGAIDAATSLPVSVDLENGFGSEPADVAHSIRRVAGAGAVAASIEDWHETDGLYPLDRAVERIAAACEAAAELDFPFMVTGRAENHIRGNPNLEDTIARLQAYERAGAHILYAPGLHTAEEIRAVCEATSRPVNVLAFKGLSITEIFAAGARRASVGGGLAWTAIEAMAQVAEAMRDGGDTSGLAPGARIRAWIEAQGAFARRPLAAASRSGPHRTIRLLAWKPSHSARPAGPSADYPECLWSTPDFTEWWRVDNSFSVTLHHAQLARFWLQLQWAALLVDRVQRAVPAGAARPAQTAAAGRV